MFLPYGTSMLWKNVPGTRTAGWLVRPVVREREKIEKYAKQWNHGNQRSFLNQPDIWDWL